MKPVFVGMMLALLISGQSVITLADDAEMPLEFMIFQEVPKVTSATKSEQSISEAPAVITVITDKDIRDAGYESLAEALSQVPGVFTADDHSAVNLGVRGIMSDLRGWGRDVKVMIDGQPVAYRVSGINFLGEELIPLSAVSRVEIIRGPVSALYGANAFLGVINIITKDETERKIETRYGYVNNQPKWGGELLISEKEGGLQWLISSSFSRINTSGLQLPETSPDARYYVNDDVSQNSFKQPRSFYAKLRHEDETFGRLTITGNYQRMDSSGEFVDWEPLSHMTRLSLDNWFIKATYERTLIDKLDMEFSYDYASGGPTDQDRLDVGHPYYWSRRDESYTAQDIMLEGRYAFSEKDFITLGADYTYEIQQIRALYNVYSSDFGAYDIGDEELIQPGMTEEFENLGVYFQGTMNFVEKLGITLGLRMDNHNIYGEVYNYHAGLVYQFSPVSYGKLLYGSSFKAPTAELLYTSPLMTADLIGNPELKPEKAVTYEGMVGFKIGKAGDATAGVYLNQIQDKTAFVSVAGGNLIAKNQDAFTTVGLEAEFKGRVSMVDGYTNIALENTTIDGVTEEEDQIIGSYPAIILNAGINYNHEFFTVNLNTHLIGERMASASNIVKNSGKIYYLDSYNITSLTISSRGLKWLGTETVFTVKAENVFDQPYQTAGFRGIDIPGNGRNIIVKVSQNF